jgi:hypothetical protein
MSTSEAPQDGLRLLRAFSKGHPFYLDRESEAATSVPEALSSLTPMRSSRHSVCHDFSSKDPA